MPCGEVYQAYTSWCGQNGYHPLNASNFGKEVKRTFPDSVKMQKRKRGQRIWVFSGLSVREGSEVAIVALSASVTSGTSNF
ncbi:MAG: primase-like DNA-binding domain-containing protein [Planctomycetota bacterium]